MSIVAVGLSASYGAVTASGRPRPALRGLSFSVAPGEVLGVVGPNGSGKTTLMRILTRRLEPSGGCVSIDGRDLASFGRFELARTVALVAQAPEVPAGFSVTAVVAMGRAPHLGLFGVPGPEDDEAVSEALRATDTERFASRRIETLSGGERQRVVFARALAQQPHYLLLDEPTNHLDLKYQVELLRYGREQAINGVGLLVVLHDLNLAARSCDRLLVLKEGELVVEGPPAEVLEPSLIAEVFGAEVRVLEDGGVPVIVPFF